MDMYLRMRGPRDKQVKNVEAAAYSLIKRPSRKALESLIHEEQILKAKEAPIRGLKDVLLECFRNNIGEQKKWRTLSNQSANQKNTFTWRK